MKYIDAEKLIANLERQNVDKKVIERVIRIIASLQQEQPSLPTIKGWIARDDANRLGLYDQKPTRKTELGFSYGIVNSWVIGDTWIGRFSLDQTSKTLFPNLRWTDEPIEVELIIKPIQEQPDVDYNKFEKLLKEFCERNKGHHITSHDACMWFWELGLKARKEE